VFKQANKQQILKDVYEENLWVAGKSKSRRSVVEPISSSGKKNRFLPYLVAVGVIVVTGVVTAWHEPVEQTIDNKVALDQRAGAELQNTSMHNAEGDGERDSPIPAPTRQRHGEVMTALYKPIVPMQATSTALPGLFYHDEAQADLEAFGLDQSRVTPENFRALASVDMPLAQLFGLSVKTIVIDPGHGGKDPGAVGDEIYEKDIALEVAKRLRDRLLEYENYRVLMTRETDVTMSLNNRVNYANENGADLFISIHVNNFPTDQKSFIETYYFGPTDDSNIAELAARENSDSHYPYAEFKEIIQKIGDTLKFQESKQLAYAVQRNLYQQMNKIDKRTSDHGIKAAPFVVLLGLDAPSILTEVSCLCNKDEEQRLKTSAYRENIASFLEKGIVTYLNKNTRVGGMRNGEKEKLAKAQQ